jgi:hypothetical protein
MNETYRDMQQNTVSAEGQLKDSRLVRFHHPEGKGPRILIAGNSITLHAPSEGIGWFLECGMAASAPEKDYVHQLEAGILAVHRDASFCICQVADWERGYLTGGDALHEPYASARDFGADVIVLRFVENCRAADFDGEIFRRELDRFVRFLDGSGKASANGAVIVSTGFWRHPGDEDLLRYAKEQGFPSVVLGDLGADNAMKAIGLFAHGGVASHPGDAGMKAIAERLAPLVLTCLQKVES